MRRDNQRIKYDTYNTAEDTQRQEQYVLYCGEKIRVACDAVCIGGEWLSDYLQRVWSDDGDCSGQS